MRCFKTADWYKPLSIHSDHDFNVREINAFYVFDETGVIYKRDYGYFDSDVGFEINVACVKKIKVDFKCKTAFLISHDGGKYDGLQYDVYIPASVLGIKKPIYEKEETFKRIKKTIKTNIKGVQFVEYKMLDRTLWNIYHEMQEDVKKLASFYVIDDVNVFDDALKHLKKARTKYGKELERIKNYTIEDAIKEGF